MKKNFVILLAAATLWAACKSEKKGSGGLLYTIYKESGKPKIKVGDIIKINFIQKNDKDSIMFNSFDLGQAQVFPVQKATFKGDMNDMLTLLGEGDSAFFKVNLDTLAAKNKQPKPEQFKNNKYLHFTIKIEKVISINKGEADSVFQKRAKEFFQKDYQQSIEKMKAAEPGKIKAYIKDKGWKPTVSASGLQYVIEKLGGTDRAAMTDTVEINYTGSLAVKKNGKYLVFDTNIQKTAKESGLDKKQPWRTYGPAKMVLGSVVPGFSEALTLIGKGGKIKAIIPSKIGYGEQSIPQAGIAPSSPLVFEIEMINIIKAATPPSPTIKPPSPPVKKQ